MLQQKATNVDRTQPDVQSKDYVSLHNLDGRDYHMWIYYDRVLEHELQTPMYAITE